MAFRKYRARLPFALCDTAVKAGEIVELDDALAFRMIQLGIGEGGVLLEAVDQGSLVRDIARARKELHAWTTVLRILMSLAQGRERDDAQVPDARAVCSC